MVSDALQEDLRAFLQASQAQLEDISLNKYRNKMVSYA
jgi:hypothetical protein